MVDHRGWVEQRHWMLKRSWVGHLDNTLSWWKVPGLDKKIQQKSTVIENKIRIFYPGGEGAGTGKLLRQGRGGNKRKHCQSHKRRAPFLTINQGRGECVRRHQWGHAPPQVVETFQVVRKLMQMLTRNINPLCASWIPSFKHSKSISIFVGWSRIGAMTRCSLKTGDSEGLAINLHRLLHYRKQLGLYT